MDKNCLYLSLAMFIKCISYYIINCMQILKAIRKMIIFVHLVTQYSNSLGLEFVAPIVNHMCKKYSCKISCQNFHRIFKHFLHQIALHDAQCNNVYMWKITIIIWIILIWTIHFFSLKFVSYKFYFWWRVKLNL
jgi:predicted metalloenzyme YecM